MKIATNLSREHIGGITSSTLNLIHYLYRLDNEFVVLEMATHMYMKGPSLFRSFDPEVFDHHIINVHHLPFMRVMRRSRTLGDLKRAYAEPIRLVRMVLRETNPDVVLLSGTYFAPWIISVAAKLEKKPVVLWYAGVLSKELEHYPDRLRRLFAAMEKDMVASASKIVFPSELCKKTVEQDVLKKKVRNSYVIPNPVAATFTEPSPTDASIERRIAAVGRYSRIKNFDKFFDLHRELLKREWRHTASFVTREDANFKKMPKAVEMLPPMTAEGLKKFYLSQGLIVCPSRFETFGNVPMEAACLGIPVLVSDTMGCAEVLKKVGLENMVISFDDMEVVADRAQELCGQSIQPKQLNALKRILDNNFVSEELRAVLNTVVRQNCKGSLSRR